MTEEELLEECLLNFPTIFKEALVNKPKIKEKFIKNVSKEYKELPVYRALCYENSIIDEDFLSYNELALLRQEEGKLGTLEWYSVSVNEDREQLINVLDIPNEERKILGIAKGMMQCEFGPADFVGKKTHHNWYLYDGVIPSLKVQFKIEPILAEKGDNYDDRFGILE